MTLGADNATSTGFINMFKDVVDKGASFARTMVRELDGNAFAAAVAPMAGVVLKQPALAPVRGANVATAKPATFTRKN